MCATDVETPSFASRRRERRRANEGEFLKSKTVEELLEDIDADWNTGPLKAGKEIALRLEEAQQRIADLEKAHELVAMAFENRIEKHLATVAELEEAQERIAERDAALARCVEALKAAEGAIMDEVCASSGEDHPVINAHAKIAENARKVLASLPTSAQATAKVLAAARRVAYVTTSKVGDPQGQADAMHDALTELAEAIREEKEGE